MFKGLTKDLTGSADICNTAKDFGKLHAASYLLPGEDILFAFESAKEEFAFTNEALIMTVGENATTTRKLVQRATYRDCPISGVLFETTGRVDRDCEIKFHIGEFDVSIDIARKEEEFVKGFYKTLLLLARAKVALSQLGASREGAGRSRGQLEDLCRARPRVPSDVGRRMARKRLQPAQSSLLSRSYHRRNGSDCRRGQEVGCIHRQELLNPCQNYSCLC